MCILKTPEAPWKHGSIAWSLRVLGGEADVEEGWPGCVMSDLMGGIRTTI